MFTHLKFAIKNPLPLKFTKAQFEVFVIYISKVKLNFPVEHEFPIVVSLI